MKRSNSHPPSAARPIRRPLRRSLALAGALLALALPQLARAQEQELPFDRAAAERFLAGVPAADEPYLVHTGARWVLPRPDARPSFQAGRAVVYLQFEGALAARERAELEQRGVRFLPGIPHNAYLARIAEEHLPFIRSLPGFRGVQELEPVDKLVAPLWFGLPNPMLQLPDGSSLVVVSFHEDVRHEHALHVLDRWDVPVRERGTYGLMNRVEAIATHGQVLALAEEPSVRLIEEGPWPVADDNTAAAELSNVDDVQAPPWSLTGFGVRLGIWEVGGNPLVDHPDFGTRILERQAAPASDHATHVAGTIMGSGAGDPSARGMAPQGRLDSYTADNAPMEQFNAFFDNVIATNNSWGSVVGWSFDGTAWTFNANQTLFGAYDGETQAWDTIANLVPVSVQKSAGNDRDDCDPTDATDCDGDLGADGERYDTIPHRGAAKNVITVGALNDDGTIAGFSSSGPTDDGRIKPDLVANGVGLTSTWAQGVSLDSCTGLDYCAISGTSMSTPVATGVVGLIRQRFVERYGPFTYMAPETVKALLVNTATDLGRPGPDYLYGHGLIDALAAIETLDAGDVRILTDSVNDGQTRTFLLEVPPSLSELRVTLAWTDPPGAANSAASDLVNDLDITLYSPNGDIYKAFNGPQSDRTAPAQAFANFRDNVEHVRVEDPADGYWEVRIYGWTVPLDPQNFTVVANSAFFLDDEPNIDVAGNGSFPATCVADGEEERIFSIFNTGGGDLLVHEVSVLSFGSFRLLPDPSPPFLLPPGAHIQVHVVYDPATEAQHLGVLRIESNDADEGVYEIDLAGIGRSQDVRATIEAKGSFGAVPLNQQETLELQVINQGLCNLRVESFNLSVGTAEFAPGEIEGFAALPFTLFPGESAVIYVTYLPTNYGADMATFNLVTDDPNTPSIPVTLRGVCLPPEISTTGSLRFGEVCPGAFEEKTLDICNTGLSDLEVTSVAFAAPCDDFVIVNNPFPATVSHDFCLGVTVRYTPTGVGSHSCDLVIESNDPVQPTVTITATGTLLPVSLDVSPDLCFPPTVIQDLADCSSCLPFPITNSGDCPVTITELTLAQPLAEYGFHNLPVLPVTLLPGEILGDGQLEICFAPEVVQRYRTATVSVTYETNDPMNGDVATVTRELVGEGVHTGLRMLVRKDGLAMATVDKVELYRVLFPGTVDETLSIVQIDNGQDLQTTLALGPCPAVDFHQEYGGESNPIVLEPGTYLVWVRHNFGQGLQSRKELVVLDDWCDFEADIALDF